MVDWETVGAYKYLLIIYNIYLFMFVLVKTSCEISFGF